MNPVIETLITAIVAILIKQFLMPFWMTLSFLRTAPRPRFTRSRCR